MPYREGERILPNLEIVSFTPAGPICERYVVRDEQGMTYELEVVASGAETPEVAKLAYRSLQFISGLRHPFLPESPGTVSLSVPAEGEDRAFREVPLWEHLSGALALNQLIESTGPLHPAQAAELILQVAQALNFVDTASRNSRGEAFPHLALTPVNIILRENRTAVVTGWGNRAASLANWKPSYPYPRFVGFLDPFTDKKLDRRHDSYGLAACFFFLLKGHPLPYQLRQDDRYQAAMETLPELLGGDLAKVVARALKPDLKERPSVETLTACIMEAQDELEKVTCERWKVCCGCGLLLRNDPDLCPLCIRDRILPATQVSPKALAVNHLPSPIRIDNHTELRSLEEVGEILPELVQRSAQDRRKDRLERHLRKILLSLVGRGLKEFVGDLICEDGSLTEDPHWIACELAHRIDAGLSDQVYLAREKGWFLRFLKARESAFFYRKTLKQKVHVGPITADIYFRGRYYLFIPKADRWLWERLSRVKRVSSRPFVVVALKTDVSAVPASLIDMVTLYVGAPPTKLGSRTGPGGLDEYGLFCFLRGKQFLGSK